MTGNVKGLQHLLLESCLNLRVWGLLLIGLSVIAQTGNIYSGLYYPIAVASLTFIVGSVLLRETKHVRIWNEIKE